MAIILKSRYLIENIEETVTGGSGTVFKATDLVSGSIVAVKKIILENELTLALFNLEAQTLRRISHPNIINLVDSFSEDGFGYLVSQWLDQGILEFLVGKQVPKKEFIIIFSKYARPIWKAISYLHSQEIAHRDISANNVMLQGLKPILIDFGSALNTENVDLPQNIGQWATPGYIPEKPGDQFQKDVYALGVLILEMVTLKRLTTRIQIEESLKQLRVETSIKEILAIAIAEEPDNRYANAMIFELELEKILSSQIASLQSLENIAQIVLTNSAKEKLWNFRKGEKSLEVQLGNHINQSLQHLSPARNEDSSISDEKFWLICDAVQLLLVPNENATGWTAVAAQASDSSKLESKRRSAKDISGWKLPWEVSRRFSHSNFSARGFKFLNSRFGEWVQSGCPLNDFQREHPDSLSYFEKLQRILEAQEEIARGNLGELTFVDCQLAGTNTLRLELQHEPTFDLTGTFWKVNNNERIFGEVDYHSGLEISIVLRSEFLGKLRKTGKLMPDISYGSMASLKRQRDAIKSLSEGTAAGRALGGFLADPRSVPINNPSYPEEWRNKNLDMAKREAVASALGSKSLTLVLGPPGTGKTTFISELVAQTLLHNPEYKILIVSQTHVAIDNAIEKLLGIGITGLVRLANPENERISKTSKPLLLDVQLKNWVKELEEKSRQFAFRESQKNGLTIEEVRELIEFKTIQNKLREYISVFEDSTKDAIYKSDGLDNTEVESSSNISQVIEVSDERSTSDIVESLRNKISANLQNISSEEMVFDGTNAVEIQKSLQSRIDKIIGERKVPERFLEIIQTQSDWLLRVGNSDQLSSLFLKTCRVLAGTCIGFLCHPSVRDLQFDLCILDEASQATMPVALVSMAKATKWVIVGDDKQLGPFQGNLRVTQEFLAEFEIEKDDLIETFFSRFAEELCEENRIMLDTQYRMHNSIGNLISECFYSGKVHSDGPGDWPPLVELGLSPLTWLDTSGYASELRLEKRSMTSNSISNVAECEEIRKALSALSPALNIDFLASGKVSHVLIVTPYLHQIEALKSNLSEFLSEPNFKVEIATIDSVQGREADVVFFSAVRSNNKGETGFLSMENFQRINVALTRGRHLMAIVGDVSFWQELNAPLSEVLRLFPKHGGVIKSFQNA